MNDSGRALILLPGEAGLNQRLISLLEALGRAGGFYDMDMCSAIADRRQGW
jgi:hypothetical protein